MLNAYSLFVSYLAAEEYKEIGKKLNDKKQCKNISSNGVGNAEDSISYYMFKVSDSK